MNGTKVGSWVDTRNLTYAKVGHPPSLDHQPAMYASTVLTFVSQILDSSHMVGYDKPHVTNDMITRFMDVDFQLLPGILASSSSKIGSKNRVAIGAVGSAGAGIPLLKGGDTDWEGESGSSTSARSSDLPSCCPQ